MTEPRDQIGFVLREVEPYFTAEKAVSFDPVQMIYLQKLVRESALQAGVSIRKEDFFKAIVYLDYFTEIVVSRTTLFEDIGVIVEELEKMHEFLDPDVELLVRYSALFIIKDLKGERFFRKNTRKQIERRHGRTDQAVAWEGDGNADLFYGAVGQMFLDQLVTDTARGLVERCAGRNDLRALIVIDSLLAVLPAEGRSAEAEAALAAGEIVNAVIEILAALVSESKDWSLKSYVARIKSQLEKK